MRFISSSPGSPAHSLDKVRGIRPIAKNSPFAELDAIYTHIFSQAEDWDSVKDVLASQYFLPRVAELDNIRAAGHVHDCTICTLLAPLGLTESDIESSLSDLVAVMRYNRKVGTTTFYHASLQDFLFDKSRSKSLYIDLQLFGAKLASAHITTMSSFCTLTQHKLVIESICKADTSRIQMMWHYAASYFI